MTKLYEVLAAESSVNTQAKTLITDVQSKFKKLEPFKGHTKTLEFLTNNPENDVKAAQFHENKPVVTTVFDTLDYALGIWAKREDLLNTKNTHNCIAKSHIIFRGITIAQDVPVDELMGLESRLTELRNLFQLIPTLDASKTWVHDEQRGPGFWRVSQPVIAAKTERLVENLVVVPATDKHPAQVKESSREQVVGRITQQDFSGAATTYQLAESLTVIDELIVAVKQARNRANAIDVTTTEIGKTIVDLILTPLKPAPLQGSAA